MKFNKIFKSAILILAFFAITQTSFAIGVKPVRTELNLAPGESKEVTLLVINKDDKEIQAIPEVEVFLRNDEKGFPIPAELAEDDIQNIRSWIDIPMDPISINPKGTKEIAFKITVPEGAEPGGKYATVVYSPVANKDEGDVKVVTRVASLILVNVKGEIVLSGNINSLAAPKKIRSDNPFVFTSSFKNTGNTHVKPQGWIEIKDKKTGVNLKAIAKYSDPKTGKNIISDKMPVNLHGGNVLPGSDRIFTSEWIENIEAGDYVVTLYLKYADEKPEIKESIDFEIKEDLQIKEFKINMDENQSSFNLAISNNGNVHEKIMGVISIENDFGYKIAEVKIPENIEYITPGETRVLTLDWLKKKIQKGKYKAVLSVKYGLGNVELNSVVEFGKADNMKWYLIGGGLLIIMLMGLGIFLAKRR